jgi:DNA-binding IclR family transcriptional regulator
VTTSSPPTRRVVDIIELLAERRGSTTRLSDIVHALGLNQATAYVILKELCETGWVTRNPADKTFSIGAALVRLAGRIDQSPSIAHAARAAASGAATETGYAASVSERVGDWLVITAFIAGHDDQWSLSAGDRVPFAAPFGPAFAAWEPADERRVWIERSGVSSPAFEARLEEHLEETRHHGFSVERMSPDMVSAIPIMTRLQMDAQSDSVREHLNGVLLEITGAPRAVRRRDHGTDLRPTRSRHAQHLRAPLHGPLISKRRTNRSSPPPGCRRDRYAGWLTYASARHDQTSTTAEFGCNSDTAAGCTPAENRSARRKMLQHHMAQRHQRISVDCPRPVSMGVSGTAGT